MYGNAAAKAYQRVDLESAPRTQIVERLFERFARDAADARAAILAKDLHAKAKALSHASAIALQLKLALDHKTAPKLCARLEALYQFVIDRLSLANYKLEVKPIDQATAVMAKLGGAFRGAFAKADGQ